MENNITWMSPDKVTMLAKSSIECHVLCLFESNTDEFIFPSDSTHTLTANQCTNLLETLQDRYGESQATIHRGHTQYHGDNATIHAWGLVSKEDKVDVFYSLRLVFREKTPLQLLVFREVQKEAPSLIKASENPIVQHLVGMVQPASPHIGDVEQQ